MSEETGAGYDIVVMGGSAGGFKAFTAILGALPTGFSLPLLLVQHLHREDDGAFTRHLENSVSLPVTEAVDKERIEPGRVYVAPADYHMLVERDGTIALSTEGKVNWSRPSIDVLFESASRAYGERVIGIILSGASSDGAEGIRAIRSAGGFTIAQNPDSAEYPFMPRSAIETGAVVQIMTVEEIIVTVAGMCRPHSRTVRRKQ